MRRILIAAALAGLTPVAGCVAVDTAKPTETEKGVERWECGDYFDGCGSYATDCVTLTAYLEYGWGTVEVGGIVEDTLFRIVGIERRWDWCLAADGAYDCALVVSVDGTGRYYDFRLADDDGMAEQRDLLKCAKI